jgi:hypothetical protein
MEFFPFGWRLVHITPTNAFDRQSSLFVSKSFRLVAYFDDIIVMGGKYVIHQHAHLVIDTPCQLEWYMD